MVTSVGQANSTYASKKSGAAGVAEWGPRLLVFIIVLVLDFSATYLTRPHFCRSLSQPRSRGLPGPSE
jgi:hypothetical protein